MEVILGPMLASQPCLHAFSVLTSLHLPFIFIENVFLLFLLIIIDSDTMGSSDDTVAKII